ncbi:TAP42-like protein [Phycomyces nitens]|nr:TAP42-like protein [Phycomyces nitens]
MEGLSLGQLFSRSQATLNSLEETQLASVDPAYQQQVIQAIEQLQQADALVTRLAIFSSNEFLDDINANDLRFLLIPAYLGELILKQTNGDRRKILIDAKDAFHRFLATCQEHQLIQKQDMADLEASLEDKKRAIPAAQQRNEKIARYRREKAAREKLIQLRDRLLLSESRQTKDPEEDDDDVEREIVVALIDIHILKSLEHLHAIHQEMMMVKEMEAMQDIRMQKPGQSTTEDDRVPTGLNSAWGRDKPLLSKEGRPLQPFVITNKRQQLADQVFRPGHNLPTMTIDEYLQQEMEQGNIISGGGKEPEKQEVDDEDEAAVDAETIKQRNWDEFKEANPKGWGNRGNKG